LLASGRDCDIFEYGAGLVVRRSRLGRSQADEAATMRYVGERGYPVPAVDDLSDDGSELVMERIEGPSMVEAARRRPWTIRGQGVVLADLHRRLHEIEAPEFLRPAPVGHGDRVVHLDLHPLNVIISPRGPVVIDWTNAARGDPATDVGLTWLLLVAGELPAGGVKDAILGLGRSWLTSGFLAACDLSAVRPQLRELADWKAQDQNISASERQAMRSLVDSVMAD
jgi:aminoglycoside phosphotransferase (APT) family kinase protein